MLEDLDSKIILNKDSGTFVLNPRTNNITLLEIHQLFSDLSTTFKDLKYRIKVIGIDLANIPPQQRCSLAMAFDNAYTKIEKAYFGLSTNLKETRKTNFTLQGKSFETYPEMIDYLKNI